MKYKTIFTLIGTIHILIGLCVIGMMLNFDSVIGSLISHDVSEEVNSLLLKQLRVITFHALGIGLILFFCRNIENEEDIKRILRGYIAFACLILSNAFYGEFVGQGGPPLPIFILLIAGAVLGGVGILKK